MMFSPEQGKEILKLARDSIASEMFNKDIDVTSLKKFNEKQGVFVTLNKDGELRGCIGFPYAMYPLYQGIIEAAKAAAFDDPRFPPLSEEEFEDIEIEVSVLSVPKFVEVKESNEYFDKIKVGRDGLIIKSKSGSGLLLPQVPVEWEWDVKTFLEHLCLKAGMQKEAWKDLKNEIYSFRAQIFEE